MKKPLILLYLVLASFNAGITQNVSIGLGMNYGGPLPTETIDSSDGKPLVGLMAGAAISIPINDRLSFYPSIYYSFRGIEYSQSFTTDTLIEVEINETTAVVPSFYTAHVNGAMRLHYFDINLLLMYRIKKFKLMFGPYFSLLFTGKDAGNVRVVIGHGGFFDDFEDEYNNFSAIRKVEPGLMIGSIMPIYKKLNLETRFSRSLLTLYMPGKLPDRGQGSIRMFNTFFHMALVYNLGDIKQILSKN